MSTTYAQKTHAETTHSKKIQIKNTNNMEQKESSETGTTNQYIDQRCIMYVMCALQIKTTLRRSANAQITNDENIRDLDWDAT